MKKIIFITGGARSGKSAQALSLVEAYGKRRAFIATAEPFDDEMKERIRRHREARGTDYLICEEPLDPARAVRSLPSDVKVAVIDCLTVWVGNLMHHGKELAEDSCAEIVRFLKVLEDPPCDLVIVSNELGMGIVPENSTARRFRDLCGRLNQKVAERAHTVLFTVSGIPITLKGIYE